MRISMSTEPRHFDYENNCIQKAMEDAKARFTSEERNTLNMEACLARLPMRLRFAVLVCTLHYQVENGGFAQWVGNRYIDDAGELIGFLEKLPAEGSKMAALLVYIVQHTNFAQGQYVDKFRGWKLDELYVAWREQFLLEVDDLLKAHATDDAFEAWFFETPRSSEKLNYYVANKRPGASEHPPVW